MDQDSAQLQRELVSLGIPRKALQEAQELMEWNDEQHDCT